MPFFHFFIIVLFSFHIYFTVKLKFIQKKIPLGIKLSFSKQKNSGISSYAALSTALAATIGTGNIIGVSTAIAIGGPGAVFWCWLTGVFGIATCYAESYLSSKYKVKKTTGEYIGGPMYVLNNVLHKKLLAVLFCLFTIFASLGIGSSIQSHSIYMAIEHHLSVSPHIIGIIIALFSGFVILGGIQSISKFCTFLVPFMSIFYVMGCIYLLIQNRFYLVSAISCILTSAFSNQACLGGITGGTVLLGIRIGISKGLFTNEAGLGSIPMTAAISSSSSPRQQAFVSMTGPFWDTVIICAITGLTIVSSMLHDPISYIHSKMDEYCFTTFSNLPFCGSEILSISLILFSFATIIGWCYYGECSMYFLTKKKGIKYYYIIYIICIYLGAIMPLQTIWNLSDSFNLLMLIPNLISLWLLRKEVIESISTY